MNAENAFLFRAENVKRFKRDVGWHQFEVCIENIPEKISPRRKIFNNLSVLHRKLRKKFRLLPTMGMCLSGSFSLNPIFDGLFGPLIFDGDGWGKSTPCLEARKDAHIGSPSNT